ncbi:MAG: anthranilate synthase component II [Phyllobacterium sp.]
MILIIDNYDSFVFTVARYFVELGQDTRVVRNDLISPVQVASLAPSAIVLSPGPCGPKEAGQSLDIIRSLSGRIPILGICLGHQCIGEAFGGVVTRAKEPMHGRASAILHDGSGLFEGLDNPFRAARYHSLIIDGQSLTALPLRITARSEQGEVMAVAHNSHLTYGVQFHPESVLTETGYDLLSNFIRLAMIERDGNAQPLKTDERMHG